MRNLYLITPYFLEYSCVLRLESRWEAKFCMYPVLWRATAHIYLELLGPLNSMFLLQPEASFPLWLYSPYSVLSFFFFFFYSYDHELVFGVSLKNMNKAERLTFGESLMTHAMTFTAVSEKVWPSACLLQCLHRWTHVPLQTVYPTELRS